MMNTLPLIRIDSIGTDNTDNYDVPDYDSESNCLSVPDESYVVNNNLSDLKIRAVSADSLNSQSDFNVHNSGDKLTSDLFRSVFLGKLWITVEKPDHDKPCERQLTWVQLYRKSSSIASKLHVASLEIPTFAVFMKAIQLNGQTHDAPDLCSPPVLCLNLKHTKCVIPSRNNFDIVTRSGEGHTIHAQVADSHSVQFWVDAFNHHQNTVSEIAAVRSAPNSPKHGRRRTGSMSPVCLSLSVEPLNEIQETENET